MPVDASFGDVEFLTVQEVAATLRVSDMTVYRLTQSGDLETIRVGRCLRIRRSSLIAYLQPPKGGILMPTFIRPARVTVEEGGGGLGLPVGVASLGVAVAAVVLFVAAHLSLLLAAGMVTFAATAFVYRLLCRVPLVSRREAPAPPVILQNEKAPAIAARQPLAVEAPRVVADELIPLAHGEGDVHSVRHGVL